MNNNTLTNGMKVKALKTLTNIIIEGNIYDVETIRREISCINVNDTNWFEPYIESNYNIGEFVSFKKCSKKSTIYGRKLIVNTTDVFKVIDVKPNKCGSKIVPMYTVENIENGVEHRYYTFESEIEKAKMYYTLSFSEKEIKIHKINKVTFDNKFSGKAKAMFVYNSADEAKAAKEYFENYAKNRNNVE